MEKEGEREGTTPRGGRTETVSGDAILKTITMEREETEAQMWGADKEWEWGNEDIIRDALWGRSEPSDRGRGSSLTQSHYNGSVWTYLLVI